MKLNDICLLSVVIDIKINSMLISVRITLLAFLLLWVIGQDDGQVENKSVNGIKPNTSVMDWIYG